MVQHYSCWTVIQNLKSESKQFFLFPLLNFDYFLCVLLKLVKIFWAENVIFSDCASCDCPFSVGDIHFWCDLQEAFSCDHNTWIAVFHAAMMLGFQGSTSPSKVYRCVACSATFTGLASLLVHQATHASALSKVSAPPHPDPSPDETLLSSMDSSSEHTTAPSLLPESPSPSFYICDCGEEFQDFTLMLEHKRSHISELEKRQPAENDNNNVLLGTQQAFPSQQASFSPTATHPGLGPSTSRSPAVDVPTVTDHNSDVNLEEGIIATSLGQCTALQDVNEKQDKNISATGEKISASVKDFQDQKKSVSSSANGENSPKKNNIMNLLASAYMKRFTGPHSYNQNNDTITPKKEAVPIDITSRPKTSESRVSQINDCSIAQLRRLLARPGIKTKAPSISMVLESSKKKVVSLTKTLSPVVVLETRQKLKDPTSNGTYGKYQCGRCRRVFQNLDRLTEHHFLHKKERIKCCRRCKQLIIGRLPLPDNHICPQLGNKAIHLSRSLKHKFPFSQKLVPFHSLSNTRKVFFCPLCKHSYARRWNLKNHKCQGPGSTPPLHTSHSFQEILLGGSISKPKTDAEVGTGSQISKNVAVGTEGTSGIKVETTSSDTQQSSPATLIWSRPTNSFSPFYPTSSMTEQCDDDALSGVSAQKGEESSSWDAAEEDDEDSNGGQWTMPLDDEMEVLSSVEKTGNGIEEKSGSVEHAETTHPNMCYFVRNGVKRYPCNRCQKTYSRPCTLRRHLRLCGFRLRGVVAQSGTQGDTTLNANNSKPMFPCYVCGKTFNRKDNMMTHRNRCLLHRSLTDTNRGTVQQNMSDNSTDSQSQEDDGSNWGIMSLPSVLPRRVTCECGVGFTSPRLLLEHLQKHAQESYTCPTCGETVNSWADYEVHLQIHMHPNHQLLKGLQPQRSQPLLLRFQQQQPPPQPSPTVHPPPTNQAVTALQLPNPPKKQQRIVCTRCGNTFATRCSLRRHISRNRCKGLRATNPPTNPPKTYHCSHCNSNFPNTISLLFHQRSGACKPTIKPVRCPVCLRWFGTMDSLQKHLFTHKQSESFQCDVCRGTYPNLKSLKNHRRRIHRIMAGDSMPKTQEQLTS